MQEDKIRKRESYKRFDRILEAFRRSEEEGLRQMFFEMNNKSMFGSMTHAQYASESINLLIQDKTNGKYNS